MPTLAAHLTTREATLLENWRRNEEEVRLEVRSQALVDVSSIMGWLTCKDYSREYLHEMVLTAFERASDGLPDTAVIKRHLVHYRKVLSTPEKKVTHPLDVLADCARALASIMEQGKCALFADATGGPMGNVIDLYRRAQEALKDSNHPSTR